MGPEKCSGVIQQSHVTWSCSHIQKKATFSRDTLTLQRLLRKTENLRDCPSSKQFPSTAAGPDLTSCHSKNAEPLEGSSTGLPFAPAQIPPRQSCWSPASSRGAAQCSLIPGSHFHGKQLLSSLTDGAEQRELVRAV